MKLFVFCYLSFTVREVRHTTTTRRLTTREVDVPLEVIIKRQDPTFKRSGRKLDRALDIPDLEVPSRENLTGSEWSSLRGS